MQARRDLSVVASHVVSDLGTSLQAGRDLSIQSQAEQTREHHFEEFKTSGFGAGGFLWGKTKQSLDQDRQAQSAAGSTVASLLGDVQLQAGASYQQRGSLVQAPGGDIGIRAGEVRIDTAREHEVTKTVQRYEASGISLGLGGAVGSALSTVQQQVQAAEQTSSGRMQALAGLNSAASVYNAAQSLQAADAAKAQALLDGKPEPANTAIGLRIGFSSSKSQSTSIEERHSGAGSAVQAGGKVAIEATSGDLTIQGSRLEAGGDLSLKAEKDLKLQASENIRQQSNDSSSRSTGFGVTLFANGIGVDASASRSQANSRTEERTQVASVVNAGGTATLASGNDTNLVGAQVRADRIEAEVGGDLNIHSLQDTSSTRGKSSSAGIGLGFGVGGPSLNVSVGRGQLSADYASVQQQAGLFAGAGGFDVQVSGKTELVGGAIVGAQGANNQLSTGTLEARDLANRADYSASSVGISLGTGAAGLNGSGGFGQDSGHAASTTRSAIGQGTVTTDAQGQQALASVRRDQTSEQDGAQRIAPIFDQRKVQAEVAAQVAITSALGQTFQAIGTYAGRQEQDALSNAQRAAQSTDGQFEGRSAAQWREQAQGWSDGGPWRVALHAAAGALGGGLQGAAGAGAAALAAPQLNQAQAQLEAQLKTQGLGDAAAAAAAKTLTGSLAAAIGAVAGGSPGALLGAGVDLNNRQLHETEKQKLEALKRGKSKEEQQRLDDAACAMTRCADGLRDDDPTKLAKLESARRGASYLVEIQQLGATGEFRYSEAESAVDRLNRIDPLNAGKLGVAEEQQRRKDLQDCQGNASCISGTQARYDALLSARIEAVLTIKNSLARLEACGSDNTCASQSVAQLEKLREDLKLKGETADNLDRLALSTHIARAKLGIGDTAGAMDSIGQAAIGALVNDAGGGKTAGKPFLGNLADVWKQPSTDRGIAIESHLAATEYKDWFNVGQLNNGKFPLVDFQNENILVSLKSIDTAGSTWMARIQGHINDLGSSGATINGVRANMVLDVRTQPGGMEAAQPLIEYGKQHGVIVIIKEFK